MPQDPPSDLSRLKINRDLAPVRSRRSRRWVWLGLLRVIDSAGMPGEQIGYVTHDFPAGSFHFFPAGDFLQVPNREWAKGLADAGDDPRAALFARESAEQIPFILAVGGDGEDGHP